jgi:chemotaxis protein methyltransferase CheR
MSSLELSPPVFTILGRLLEDQAGLHYDLLDRDILGEKAAARALEAGFDSLLDYYYFLRYDPGGGAELSELVEALLVKETYFFREWTSVVSLVDTLIAPMCQAGESPRIWSAACATGEEPLSLAMLLSSRGLLDKVELVATDISARAIEIARRGRYGRRSLRQVPEPKLVERYIREQDGAYVVRRDLVNAIRWDTLNLVDGPSYRKLGTFDAILCRNVLIYFSDETVCQVLRHLHQALRDGGILLVGVSESLLRYGLPFVAEERGGAFLYRKGAHP